MGMTDDREAELEEGRMPLLDHLIELRNRLMWSIGALLVAFLICYQFKERIYGFLVHPLAVIFEGQTGRHLIYTGLTEAFFTYVKVSFWAGLCLAFPIIASQIWKFVAPGLYKNERRAFYPYLFATPVLFAAWADGRNGNPDVYVARRDVTGESAPQAPAPGMLQRMMSARSSSVILPVMYSP